MCCYRSRLVFNYVAFKTLEISKGGVATHLRCGRIFSNGTITIFPSFDSEIILKIG